MTPDPARTAGAPRDAHAAGAAVDPQVAAAEGAADDAPASSGAFAGTVRAQDPQDATASGAPLAPGRRIPFLDAARAVAIVGVVLMNATTVVMASERAGEAPGSTLASVVDGGLSLLFAGKSRALLMVLLGVGAVLALRSVRDRGGRPAAVMVRRYAVLGLLFGLPHLAVFNGDILTHYALTALALTPLLPLLLAGSRARPLVAAGVLFALAPVVESLLDLGDLGVWSMQVAPLPQTLGFFCAGVWLARRPELDPRSGAAVPTRLPAVFVWTGLAAQVLGLATLYLRDVLFPMELDADGAPVNLTADGMPDVPAGGQMLVSLSGTFTGLGGAMFLLGLTWWLLRRDRTAARMLHGLAPLGRITLTVYLASTAVFLLTMGPFETQVPLLVQYGIALVLLAAALVFAHLWQRAFLAGPAEWVWRSLTHLRPVPFRRAHRR
ncbi:DUF418 domain-containing protein [Nocardiopsis salina]|uniref:DUF418 domain-containing protein n=1 Tax=Nocardiopsis salina TaxID=245836 RepID=UPI000A311383|nr:DUF418 domain-containing protein [Nocardiopsis salina]